jgi:hypothetical protein
MIIMLVGITVTVEHGYSRMPRVISREIIGGKERLSFKGFLPMELKSDRKPLGSRFFRAEWTYMGPIVAETVQS